MHINFDALILYVSWASCKLQYSFWFALCWLANLSVLHFMHSYWPVLML